jgi:hypothetical protein
VKNNKKNIFLISLQNDKSYNDYKNNVKKQTQIKSILDKELVPKEIQDNKTLSIWGFKETKDNKKIWQQIKKSDIILFLRNEKFFSKGTIVYKTNNQKILDAISYSDDVFKSKKLLIFIKDLEIIDIDLKATIPIFMNPLMPKMHNFPIKQIDKKKIKVLETTFGGIEGAIDFIGNPKNKETSISEIINLKKLKKSIKFKVKSSMKKQRMGQEKFRKNILTNFNNKCAVCGISKEELLEAAHIVPIEDNKKSGLLKNGISLCVLCHKMFDNGYFSFGNDYKTIFSKKKKIDVVLKNIVLENRKIGKCSIYPSKDYLSLHRTKFGIF